MNLFPSDKALYIHCTYWLWPVQLSSVVLVYLRWHLLRNWNGIFQTQKGWPHRNKKVKGQDHWFLPNQSDYSLFAALILLWYWNYNCVLQTNNLSSHWLGQNYTSCPFLVTFLWPWTHRWEMPLSGTVWRLQIELSCLISWVSLDVHCPDIYAVFMITFNI